MSTSEENKSSRGNLPFRVTMFMGLGRPRKVLVRANNAEAVTAEADYAKNTRAERYDLDAKEWVPL